jgi:hypothetical protein
MYNAFAQPVEHTGLPPTKKWFDGCHSKLNLR